MPAWIRRLRFGMATRLLLAFAVLLVPVVVVSAWSYRRSLEERRESALNETVQSAHTAAALVHGLLRDLDGTTLAIARSLGAQPSPLTHDTAGPYLAAVKQRYPYVRNFFLTDPRGTVIASSGPATDLGVDLGGRPYTRALLAGEEFVLSDLIPGVQTGTPTVALARTVRAPDGTLRGLLAVAFYPDQLAEIFPGTLPGDANLAVYDRTGRTVYSSNVADIPWERRDQSGSPRVQGALAGQVTTTMRTVSPLDGQERLAAAVPVPEYRWAVSLSRTRAAVDAPLQQFYRRQLLVLGLVTAGALMVALGLSRTLVRPLARLAAQARAFGHGGQGTPAPVQGPLEVRELATAFNAMAAEIERRFAERDAAEAALRESEERFRTMADSAPVLIWLAGADTLRTYVNRPWLEFTGRTIAQELGEGWAEGVHPEDVQRCLDAYRASFRARLPFSTEYRLRRHDGEYRWVLDNGVPLVAPDAAFAGYIGSCLDITERRQYEMTLTQALAREQEARQAAEAANRAKDEFLSLLSHELRTPLTPILGFTELLRRKQHVTEATLTRALDTIERSARMQARLVSDLLDVSRIVTGKLQIELVPTDLAPVIEAAVEAVRPDAEARQVTLSADLDRGVGPVLGDAGRLQQVVWNLLSNAAKFTPPGGRVEVRLDRVDGGARITVADTGTGIDPAFLPYVFDRFRQADASSTRQYGGLGLGLSIVSSLVELHGGTVRAESAGPGRGATFTVTVPLARVSTPPDVNGMAMPPRAAAPVSPAETGDGQSPAAAGGAPPASQSTAGGRPHPDDRRPAMLAAVRVLVVEDDPDTLRLLTLTLQQDGAEVTAAASAAAAVAALERARPDVLVSDIAMPDEDGYGLIARVRQLAPEGQAPLPAVALTAYAGAEARERALAAGFQAYMAKPVEPDALVMLVARLAGRGGDG